MDKIQVGISACLLGQPVRFDGGHKQSRYCQEDLEPFFDFLPICPEMAIGMGTPRPSIRLVKQDDHIVVRSKDGTLDVTQALQAYSDEKVDTLQGLGGYLFCAKSPTCGMERVTLYRGDSGYAEKDGVGVFAQALMSRYPNLPVEETGRLHDVAIRENFFTRVYAYRDWHLLIAEGISLSRLTQFHARYKYLLMAHDPVGYRTLGPQLANPTQPLSAVAEHYFSGFMQVLKHLATRKNNTNVLQHIQGYFKHHITGPSKAELSEAIDKYRLGLLPLLVPITLINHHMRVYEVDYIRHQIFLNPHPEALKLRYNV